VDARAFGKVGLKKSKKRAKKKQAFQKVG